MTARPVGALLAGAVLLGHLTGCGIQPTPVIGQGEPAGGINAPARYVYFVVDGRVRPLPYPGDLRGEVELGTDDPSRRDPVELAIAALLGGPDPAARAAGVRTALPARAVPVEVQAQGASVRVVLGGGPRLSEPARHQLACTLTSALSTPERPWTGTVTVVALGADAVTAPCPEEVRDALPYAPPGRPVG